MRSAYAEVWQTVRGAGIPVVAEIVSGITRAPAIEKNAGEPLRGKGRLRKYARVHLRYPSVMAVALQTTKRAKALTR